MVAHQNLLTGMLNKQTNKNISGLSLYFHLLFLCECDEVISIDTYDDDAVIIKLKQLFQVCVTSGLAEEGAV